MTYKIWDIEPTENQSISFSLATSRAADVFLAADVSAATSSPFFLPIDHWPTPLLLSC